MENKLSEFLNSKVLLYNHPNFIADDPVCIPHKFKKQQDIEIAGFFAALLAWGNRKSIINSCNHLMNLMDNAPYDFIMNKNENGKEYIPLMKFVHRTFNATDLLHLLDFLHFHYYKQSEKSLETAFSKWLQPNDDNIERGLNGFYHYVFNAEFFEDYPTRTQKHIASPFKKSACKRLNMYLRWMVRKDNCGVDFGIWKNIQPSQLICPIDVHVSRVAKRFGLLQRTQTDWQAAIELTQCLKQLDTHDPVKYDFALFGLGVVEKYI